jgi:hypothetical protein
VANDSTNGAIIQPIFGFHHDVVMVRCNAKCILFATVGHNRAPIPPRSLTILAVFGKMFKRCFTSIRGDLNMRTISVAALLAASALTPCFGQTAVGVGVAKSDATAVSGSRSTAIGGGNATARANPTQNLTISQPAATTATINNTGTSTVRNVPSVFAPGLAAAGLETCLGSVSGGGSFVGTGFSFGSTIPDPGCAARLDARTLWSMGLKKAAIARLCLGTDIYAAMPEVCAQYLPVRPQSVFASVAPASYAQEEPPYHGGAIMLVEGATGRERLCNDYDVSHQRCRKWEGAVVRHAAAKPKVVKQEQAASQEDKSK